MMQEFVLLLFIILRASWISMLRPGIEPVISFTGVRDYARSAVASWTRLTIYNRRNDWLLCFVFACFLGIRSIYNLMNLNCNMGRGNIFLLSHQFALTLTCFFFSVFWVCISQRKVCAWFCMLPCGRHKTIVHCSLFYMATARQISPYPVSYTHLTLPTTPYV